MAILRHPIREAERYLQNARQILSEKAEKDGEYYNDAKYVRMAGNTAGQTKTINLRRKTSLPGRKNQHLSTYLCFFVSVIRQNSCNHHRLHAENRRPKLLLRRARKELICN
ncbi:MAG: DUF5618 family protein [Dysgonamonadaceae bacterium]|nr:DUF5618 family protein [Dysgonamonadaceae bacterium]